MNRRKLVLTVVFALALVMTAAVAVSANGRTGSISGVVYCDANHNWTYDTGEERAGVPVTLWDNEGCQYITYTLQSSMNSTITGAYSFVDLEVGQQLPECYRVAADYKSPALGTCNFPITPNPWPFEFYGEEDSVDDEHDFGFREIWTKTVNGQPWAPGLDVTVETSDTIVVVDEVNLGLRLRDKGEKDKDLTAPLGPYLVEAWYPDKLYLVDVETSGFSTVVSDPVTGVLTWTLFVDGQMLPSPEFEHIMTKTFHVEPCTWLTTTVYEKLVFGLLDATLEFDETVQIEPWMSLRPFEVQKTPPELWIDKTGGGEVDPGDVVSYTLSYGNKGGYENAVWIRNEFPPEAPFKASVPVASNSHPNGLWAEWAVGDLATDDEGSIDVTVEITVGLVPSTTIVVTDTIYNHVEEPADVVTTTFHIFQPPLSLGDLVWEDLDEDGIQDTGEPGVQGIEVTLHATGDCGGNDPLATDTTDADGKYLFEDLFPGTFCLEFDISAPWEISPQNQGADDSTDSDADPATGLITNINLTTDDLDQDVGIYEPVVPPEPVPFSLGDLVWKDLDQDGIQDAGEPGVAGIKVTLHGTADCGGNDPLASDVTDATGRYLFTDIFTGTYCLQFAIPAPWLISPQGQGGDDAVDSDADPATGLITSIDLLADDLDKDVGVYQIVIDPEPPEVVPEASTWLLLGGAVSGLAGYASLQIRARRRKED